jgi:hypothetical protein
MKLIDVALSSTGRREQDQHRTDVQRAADHICEKHCRVERWSVDRNVLWRKLMEASHG